MPPIRLARKKHKKVKILKKSPEGEAQVGNKPELKQPD
jgi:hypothetical protein